MELGTHYERWDRSDDEALAPNQFRQRCHMRPIAENVSRGYMRRITNLVEASGDPLLPLGSDELLQFRCRHRLGHDSPGYHIGHGGSGVFVSLLGCNAVEPVVSGQTAYYAGAYHGADLRLTLAGHRLQKDILLREGHPGSFSFRLRTTRDFDPEALTCGRLRILPPTLEREGYDSIPLAWVVSREARGWVAACDLPDGDWAGWTLDPTVTIQPGPADGKDTSLIQQNPASDIYGTNVTLYTGFASAGNSTRRTLISIDVSSVPAGATVTSSTQSLWLLSGSANTYNATLHTSLVGWYEGQGIVGVSASTWNLRNIVGSVAWVGGAGGASGSDWTAVPSATTPIGATGAWYSFDVTADIQAWVSGATNLGWWLRGKEDAYNTTKDYASSEYTTDTSKRPYLTITYTLPASGVPLFAPAFAAPFGRGAFGS